MRSEAQIRASRINGSKSKGPTTAEGRAKSSRNALKYGLTSKQLVIFDETEEDLTAFVAAQFDHWKPVGPWEEELTNQLALALWSLRRIRRAEAGIYNDAGDHQAGVFQAMTSMIATYSRSLGTALRSVQVHMDQLERAQARRRDEAVLAPIAATASGVVETAPTLAEAVAPAPAPAPAARHQARGTKSQQVTESQIVLDFGANHADGRTSGSPPAADPRPPVDQNLQNEPDEPHESNSENCKTNPSTS
jgi:hypothetical protein